MYKTILHATDLSENHFDLCQKSLLLAKSLGAKLYFLHVIETPASLQWAQSLGFAELARPIKDGAEAVMASLSESLNLPREDFFVEIGSAYRMILDKIQTLNIDLVILGKQSEHGLTGFLGSTAHAVIHHAPCDVLTLF